MSTAFTNVHLAVQELLREPPPKAAQDQFAFGPMKVIAVEGNHVMVSAGDEPRLARVAMAQSYRPAVGDEVLTIGRGSEWFVIGLLAGSGETVLSAPGDVTIAAPSGKLRLLARDGIVLKGSLVTILAEKLELTAGHLFERLSSLTQWVSGAVQRRLGRERTRVEGDSDLKAGRIVQIAEADVTIDGQRINLG